MAAADCFELMMDGPDIHCPKCNTPLKAWNWGDQILYTCSGCDVLGFNIERSVLDIRSFKVEEIVEGAKCKGCSSILEKRTAPPGIEFFTCPGCNVGLIANVEALTNLRSYEDGSSGCETHQEMRSIIGGLYDDFMERMSEL
ncbi:MAG TPA: hypothetical protein ENK47_02800 [Euryarchaeota archaeon]|nr:MAG: hypothetical protein B6U90_03765 [Thermoplasmatales archaeon ex4484_6]RLF69092.1 MAG: hypothetical protein DRN57_01840 [Thermoplasmata archaeon]HHD15616.1 hypothetical protein [Euryarchaeota archaeon]